MKSRIKKLKSFFARPFAFGLIGVIPFGIVVFVVQLIFNAGGAWGSDLLKLILPGNLEKFAHPSLGIITIAVLIWGFGVFLIWEERHNLNFLDFVVRKIPLIGHFLSRKTREELKKSTLCVFWSNETTLSVGLIRGRQTFKPSHENKDSPSMEAIIVYWGDPPLFITGRVGYFPKQLVFKAENDLGDLIKSMAALGTPIPEGISYSPWEDETFEQCAERFNALFNRAFGIK